jgi:hypothetical protein
MPRYFFHLIHPDRDAVRDDEGIMFEDDAAARREGAVSLGELMAEASKSTPMPILVSVQIVREGVGVIDLLTGDMSVLAQPQFKL